MMVYTHAIYDGVCTCYMYLISIHGVYTCYIFILSDGVYTCYKNGVSTDFGYR